MTNLAYNYSEHYSYEDYKVWEGDWELIEGQPFAMAPAPVKKHQALNAFITAELVGLFGECDDCEVLIEADYKVKEDTILRPDIAVVCKDENQDYIAKAPTIIVEILSPNTAKRDETIKFKIYEFEKVHYYILVYPKELKAKVFKHNAQGYSKEGDFFDESYTLEVQTHKGSLDFQKIFKKFKTKSRR